MATNFPNDRFIVVGGGLAGVSAANTVMEGGGKVTLLDKSAFCGGNSTKATSGINGANTRTQRAQGIEDSVELFSSDCLKGGAKKPELVKVLATNSGPDVDWLCDIFNLDLSLLARLGGHSAPRTHRGKERFPGMTITYALIQMVEKVAETNPHIARIVTKAEVTKLIQNREGAVIGCEYSRNGQTLKEFGSMILATGGFGADFTQNSLLAQYRPDLMHLPTTNGEHCTGDGIKLGVAIGANTIDLEWVQVHPTGLVNPKDPDAKVKFLAAEALRGVGGLVFDADGNRFANELGRRDYVTGEMWKNKGPFRLVLNKAASTEIIWHCKHYTGRGVMKHYKSGEELCKEMGIPLKRFVDAHQQHYEASKKEEAQPGQGPYPAYPSGKSWDEPSGKTSAGKKFYHNVIPGSAVATEEFYVAIITPVIHYCMGGLEISTKAEVIHKNGKVIPGLYAAGEVMGGVHGNNRLGGNSLLDCVVYGRVAGKAALAYQLGGMVKPTALKDISAGGLTGEVKASKNAGGSYEDNMNDAKAAAAPAAAKVAKVKKEKKPKSGGGGGGLTMDEVAKHTTNTDCWVVVNGQVLDVTNFLKDHPGGELAIMTFAGKDASEEFNMIHPGDVIQKYAPDAILGPLGGGGGGAVEESSEEEDDDSEEEESEDDDGGAGGGYTLDEVAKHTTNTDCWVVVNGQVLDVTNFLKDHPGGELAIMTFAGKDASEEFNMIHPGDVIQKYAPDAILGPLGSGTAKPKAAKVKKVKGAKPAKGGGLSAPLLDKGGAAVPNDHYWGSWREVAQNENPGVLIVNFGAWARALMYMVSAFVVEILKTVFSAKNFQFTNDRTGLTRSAIFLVFFMVIHAVGNLHVFAGPDDFNGYGYFYVRLYWTGLGLNANIVEEYCALCFLLHAAVAIRRVWGVRGSYSALKGKFKLASTGFCLLVFLCIHMMQFRFADTDTFYVRPPRYLIAWSTIYKLQLFWTPDETVKPVAVRDIYKLEYELFKGSIAWSVFYIFSTTMFFLHGYFGWAQVSKLPAFGIPKGHVGRVQNLGTLIFLFVAACYFSFPIYCILSTPKQGDVPQHNGKLLDETLLA